MTSKTFMHGFYVLNIAVALSAVFFLAPPAYAGNTLSAQEKFVQALGSDALDTLAKANAQEDVISKGIREWLHSYFDQAAIARFALGRHWRDASEAQKQQYVDIFEDLIVLTYAERLKEYSDEDFKVTGQTKLNDRDTIVNSQIIPTDANAPKTRIDWRVRGNGADMKIIDVIVEGVSMSVTQRADFDAVIQRSGGDIDAFIETLRQKVG